MYNGLWSLSCLRWERTLWPPLPPRVPCTLARTCSSLWYWTLSARSVLVSHMSRPISPRTAKERAPHKKPKKGVRIITVSPLRSLRTLKERWKRCRAGSAVERRSNNHSNPILSHPILSYPIRGLFVLSGSFWRHRPGANSLILYDSNIGLALLLPICSPRGDCKLEVHPRATLTLCRDRGQNKVVGTHKNTNKIYCDQSRARKLARRPNEQVSFPGEQGRNGDWRVRAQNRNGKSVGRTLVVYDR